MRLPRFLGGGPYRAPVPAPRSEDTLAESLAREAEGVRVGMVAAAVKDMECHCREAAGLGRREAEVRLQRGNWACVEGPVRAWAQGAGLRLTLGQLYGETLPVILRW